MKASNGPRYVVGCRRQVREWADMKKCLIIFHYIYHQIDKSKLKQGSRVALDMTTLTIMRQLPREVDPLVHNMSTEDPGDISYSNVGGLAEQIRELREVELSVSISIQWHFFSDN